MGRRYDPDVAERYRRRQAGLLGPVPVCSCCGRQARGGGRPGGLCQACWEKTPEGLEEKRERSRERAAASRARAKRKQQQG